MTQYVKGTKRLAIIKRWLQGIDDPDYDVLPTRKEGRYIVKKRSCEPTSSEHQDDIVDNESDSNEDIPDNDDEDDSPEARRSREDEEHKQPKQLKQPHKQPKQLHNPIHKQPKQQSTSNSRTDSTVNLEILEQLKQLGNEIRGKRERKEQKQLIKHVVEKQLSKKKVRPEQCDKVEYSYEYDNEDNEDLRTADSLEQPQPTFKSRIRR